MYCQGRELRERLDRAYPVKMVSITFTFLKLLTLMKLVCGDITLPAYYHDEMVMQADQDQTLIWGFTTNTDIPVMVTVSCNLEGKMAQHKTWLVADPKDFKHSTANGYVWETVYPETRNNGDICSVEIEQEDSFVLLDNIIFGDVWICSGQSNMVWPMYAIYNATEEIAYSASYTNIRMYQANLETSQNEEDDLIGGGWGGWYTADETTKLRTFSAVCFFFARHMTDTLEGDKKKVFGLIQSAWGGTRIEAWSSLDALNTCNIPPNVEEAEKNSNTVLWNAMIHPFLRHNIYGTVWYQGESNYKWNNELYNCTFPTMIRDWRAKWRGSDPTFPFGFVQLANVVGRGGVLIRWHQTADYGYAPNSDLDNVFMAVAMDTYDQGIFPGGLHPRYKQIVGERLAISGGNVAYNLNTPTNGPFPNSVSLKDDHLVEVIYDQTFTYNNNETSGFWYCCYEFDRCNDAMQWGWLELNTESVTVLLDEAKILVDLDLAECETTGAQHLAYLWKDTPVKEYLGAPIYSSDVYRLPAAPWAFEI